MKKNVETIYKESLCCSCGICIGVCVSNRGNAISYEIDNHGFFKPVVDINSCIGCGLCYDLCPGKNDLKINLDVKDSYYYGYSLIDETRINSSSGGIATELLCFLVKNKIVDYVTVVSNWENNYKPKPVLTNDINVIQNCKTSKYCPVPFGEIIQQINLVDGTIAVLGLPCQINSIKKLISKNERLSSKIIFYFSLLCNHMPSYSATQFLAVNLGIKDYSSVKYRGNGWPGKMEFTSNTRHVKKLTPYRKTWAAGFGKYFKNRRCLICNDPFARGADVVFGDAYFMEKEEKGMTFCIVRNKFLYQFLIKMNKENIIHLEEGPEISIIQKYFKVLFDRERDFTKKVKMLKTMHYPVPNIEINNIIQYSNKELIRFWLSLRKIDLGKYSFLWKYLFNKNNGKNLTIEMYEYN